MSRRFELSRLCLLVDDSLRPHTASSLVSVTKVIEKDLLITLSEVFGQIKLWTHEFDAESDDDVLEMGNTNTVCAVGSVSHPQPTHCLYKIMSNLVSLLEIKSQYVQHMAGNVLLAISEFVAVSDSYWDDFMRALCVCLELAFCNSLSSSLDRPFTAKCLDYDSSSFVLDLKLSLSNADWSSVGGIFQVLRAILKHLKHENDDQLFKVYLDSLSSCLLSLPWDLLSEICDSQGAPPNTWFEFCGYLLQFLCSLVDQSSLVRDAAGCVNEHPAIREISNIIPKILVWCLGKQGNCRSMCLSFYLRHKILVLMIRLSSHLKLDCSILVAWLHLINKYFQDLLLEPITQQEFDQDNCLEGSPFLPSLSNGEKKRLSPRHLQRLTIFLFLRCAFSLVSLRGRSKDQYLCVNLSSCMVSEQNWDPKCCRTKGLVELYEWLKKHVSSKLLESHELYSERCRSFTESFLQLYMHEDDLLFEVLLQLSCMPLNSEQWSCKKKISQEVKDDMLFLVSELFHPIQLFHLFLAEILYDHEVLLDYLISKDTGASSAEYLLRCLRTICDSWNFFMNFSFNEVMKNSPCKKRKGMDVLTHQQELFSDMEGDSVLFVHEVECQREHVCGSKHLRTSKKPFEGAKECLLSLKNSMENLHKRKLFPYNPEVLLRRLQIHRISWMNLEAWLKSTFNSLKNGSCGDDVLLLKNQLLKLGQLKGKTTFQKRSISIRRRHSIHPPS